MITSIKFDTNSKFKHSWNIEHSYGLNFKHGIIKGHWTFSNIHNVIPCLNQGYFKTYLSWIS
jgi:hypothetical protein